MLEVGVRVIVLTVVNAMRTWSMLAEDKAVVMNIVKAVGTIAVVAFFLIYVSMSFS